MRYFFLLIIMGLTGKFAVSQSNYGYGQGTIIKKTGDSIQCFVELAIIYDARIYYKMSPEDATLSIKAKDVRCIRMPFKYVESITIGNKEKLMTRVVDGPADLFEFIEAEETVVSNRPGGRISTTEYIPHYVVRVMQKDVPVKKKEFTEMMQLLFGGCVELKSKINTKGYTYSDMEKIVKEYNECVVK